MNLYDLNMFLLHKDKSKNKMCKKNYSAQKLFLTPKIT